MLKFVFRSVSFLALALVATLSPAADHICPNCGGIVSNASVGYAPVASVSYSSPVSYNAPIAYSAPATFSTPVTYAAPQTYSVQPTYGHNGGSGYAHAVQSANYRASNGIKGHGMTAGYTEGVGFSTRSAQDAIRNCCYSGSNMRRQVSVVRGRDGWYATAVYNQ